MARFGYGVALALMLAFQRAPPPDRKAYDPFHDPNVQKQADDSLDAQKKKKLEADRRQMVAEGIQRSLARDADLLVQMVTDLHGRMERDEATLTPDEMRRQVEAIEKMARSMKKRAKGEQQ